MLIAQGLTRLIGDILITCQHKVISKQSMEGLDQENVLAYPEKDMLERQMGKQKKVFTTPSHL